LLLINVKAQGAAILLINTFSSNNSGVWENPDFAMNTKVANISIIPHLMWRFNSEKKFDFFIFFILGTFLPLRF
jgi:hypothetical protein